MQESEFWAIVDSSRQAAGDEGIEAQEQVLGTLLDALPAEELVSFYLQQDAAIDALHSWDLWAAGYHLGGGMSDDGYDYFRRWVVAQGKEVHAKAIADPDSLADVDLDPDDLDGEAFSYVVADAYERKTGNDLYDALPEPGAQVEIRGERFDVDDEEALAARFPRLTARYVTD